MANSLKEVAQAFPNAIGITRKEPGVAIIDDKYIGKSFIRSVTPQGKK